MKPASQGLSRTRGRKQEPRARPVATVPAAVALAVVALSATLAAQELAPPDPPRPSGPAPKPAVEDLGDGLYRVDGIEIDQRNRRVEVAGKVTDATVLEYLACAREGFKAYESALELMTSAESFNLAMLMIGLDDDNSVPSRFKFDPELPRGDAVEIWIEWGEGVERRKVAAAELIHDSAQDKTLGEDSWVYTGSVFFEDGSYAAGVHGVLIGFMHTPESIIDSSLKLESAYGSHQINPKLGLVAGSPVRVIVENPTKSQG